jgi:DNA recombination protein RmuC
MALANLIQEIFVPDQYETNTEVVPGSGCRVEFAVRVPTPAGPLLLAIDSKFPQSDFQRLQDAQDKSDAQAIAKARKGLERVFRAEAKGVSDKYIGAQTVPFAVIFVPIESLYLEILQIPGLMQDLQREHSVVLAGPTNMHAILTTLQMGCRIAAVQELSTEVWNVLAEVQTEFGKFNTILCKVQKKLTETQNVVESAQQRTRVVGRKLKAAEQPGILRPVAPVALPETTVKSAA